MDVLSTVLSSSKLKKTFVLRGRKIQGPLSLFNGGWNVFSRFNYRISLFILICGRQNQRREGDLIMTKKLQRQMSYGGTKNARSNIRIHVDVVTPLHTSEGSYRDERSYRPRGHTLSSISFHCDISPGTSRTDLTRNHHIKNTAVRF